MTCPKPCDTLLGGRGREATEMYNQHIETRFRFEVTWHFRPNGDGLPYSKHALNCDYFIVCNP